MGGIVKIFSLADAPTVYPILSEYVFERRGAIRNLKEFSSREHWSKKWRAKPTIHNVGLLLAVDCGAAGNFLKSSVIHHKDAGKGVFAGRLTETEYMI